MEKAELGAHIRKLRKARGMTLAQVAEKVGCSTALLSQIETGRVIPSLKTLSAISRALHAPLHEIFAALASAREPDVFRKTDARHVNLSRPGSEFMLLGSCILDDRVELDVLTHTVGSGVESASEPYEHDQDDLVYVAEGTVEFQVGDQTHVLSAGDGLHIKAGTPHRWVNRGPGAARLLWIIAPSIAARLTAVP